MSTIARQVRSIIVLVLAGANVAMAATPLLRRVDAPAGRRASVARVAQLELDRGALAELRASAQSTVADFPLGAIGLATLELQRFEPFTAGANVTLMTAHGPQALALPARTYFRGTVVGDPRSKVVLVAGDDFVRGFVSDGDGKDLHRFGPDPTGRHVAWSLRDADPGTIPSSPLCQNDAHPELSTRPRSAPRAARSGRTSRQARGPYSPTLLAEVFVETDQELLELFTGPSEALDYLADLAAAISGIYDADTDVRVVFRGLRLWESTDPWRSSSTNGMLAEVRDYWIANEAATPRDVVHFISGKGVTGGVAFLDTLCDTDYGYGVSTVFGAFDIMNPADTWDITVVAHELGHNFGSPHTHCYDPPVDECYAGEGGCYDGPESLPPGGGTIMSYCHLLPGGDANINLTFGATVSAVLRAGASAAACVGDPCGDGILDPGEACDDGNITGGDCCAADCSAAAADGTSCDDGEACTNGDQCTAGSCGGSAAADGSPCDDGSLCTAESCQMGKCIAAADPAVGCTPTAASAGAQLSIKNPSGGQRDAVALRWGKGGTTDLSAFGDPLGSDDYELCLYDADADLVLSARAPAGGSCDGKPCWKTSASGYSYSDKLRTPDGISKLSLKAGEAGRAKIAVKGKGEALKMTPIDAITLPLTSQIRRAGQCWQAIFSTAAKRTSESIKAKSD